VLSVLTVRSDSRHDRSGERVQPRNAPAEIPASGVTRVDRRAQREDAPAEI
jgi:hypothetical protein